MLILAILPNGNVILMVTLFTSNFIFQEFAVSQSTLPDVQCRYQAPDPCNPSFTPTACCGGAALATNFLFLVAMVAIACRIS